MFNLTKKKVEEIKTLLDWTETHIEEIKVDLIENYRDMSNSSELNRMYKVFLNSKENVYFYVGKDGDEYDIPLIAGVYTNGRYPNEVSLRNVLMRLYNIAHVRYEKLMEENKELEEALNLFKIN